MRERGMVSEVKDGFITVKIQRMSSCGENCASCGACRNKEHTVVVRNTVNAKKGDSVMLEISSEKIMRAAFLVYVIPLMLLIAGYYLASCFTQKTLICIISAFSFMLIAFVLLHLYDKKYSEKYEPIAVSAINDENF